MSTKAIVIVLGSILIFLGMVVGTCVDTRPKHKVAVNTTYGRWVTVDDKAAVYMYSDMCDFSEGQCAPTDIIPPGTRMRILYNGNILQSKIDSNNNIWYKVEEPNGLQGWVSGDAVSVTE